ncbi:hypothetical protein O7627_24385 [Solwaraspora sp. WMMD1047]|uniref:hypothetical protein n=1 Tax=Solwaraspora sp. WMMD1047 TaxID=3016102 RepID=UPI002417204D|nr:hypothetical protein [Solwaraspora sp. WMMD1047]MDG4832422.1 hypothetical protein [Solwaraspora sp. WMMD1047]
MRYIIHTPNQQFAGERCGVAFVAGRGEVDDTAPGAKAALAYFRRRDYRVEEVSEPAAVQAEQPPAPPSPEPPARGAAKEAWIAFVTSEAAGEKRLTLDEATPLKRDELAEHVLGPKED